MAQTQTKTNQSEGEFFALVATGRKGVEDMLAKMGPEIMSVAARPVLEMGKSWTQRALLYVANNDNLKDVINTRHGLFSVYKCLAKAAAIGIAYGGQFPQAHLVPFYSKTHNCKLAELVITADGLKHTAKHGTVPVIRDIQTAVVRDNDKVTLDMATGAVSHVVDPTKPRGKLLGVWGIIEQIDGRKVARWMTYDEAIEIRDKHSIQWKNSKSGPWLDDEEMMVVKTAIKRFLKPYAAEAEGLAQMYADGEAEYSPESNRSPSPDLRDVTERAADRLDKATAAIVPEDKVQETPRAGKPVPEISDAELEIF